jgi:hypothetical protein
MCTLEGITVDPEGVLGYRSLTCETADLKKFP